MFVLKCLNHVYPHITGIVDADSSLFTYPLGKSRDTYNDLNFSPSYNPVFLDSSIESHAMDVCGDDQFCLYDIATTGRIEIGLSTLDGSRNFDKIVNLSYPSKLVAIDSKITIDVYIRIYVYTIFVYLCACSYVCLCMKSVCKLSSIANESVRIAILVNLIEICKLNAYKFCGCSFPIHSK